MLEPISAELPAPWRLAAAYAPRAAQGPWTALLALDRRLARAALEASEPMLGQLRLAWWRDRFAVPAAEWPQGEPLLAVLAALDNERPALAALVDGWERAVGGEPDAADLAALGEARAGAIVALARALGCADEPDCVAAIARAWAAADLALAFGDDGAGSPPAADPARLSRALRPLAILLAVALEPEARGLGGLLRIVRLGLLGR